MKPPKIKSGDSIGIFSPSSPATFFAPDRYKRAEEFLKSKGFNVIEGSLTGKNDFYRSGSVKERADELNELIRNPDIKCIISSIGGMNSNSLLPYIDYEQFSKTPKVLVGYSDVTAILFAVYAKTGINTYYGPAAVPSFGEHEPFLSLTYEYFKQILIDEVELPYTFPTPDIWTDEFVPWEGTERQKKEYPNNMITLNSGKAEGRLIAGNLDTMLGIWGSEYMPEIKDGDILLIEDSLKDIALEERNFSFLKINNVFDKISGLIIGKHEQFDDKQTKRKHYEVLMEVMGRTDIPVLSEFDCSHTKPMLTLPIGCRVKLDSDKKQLTILDF